MPTLLGQVHVQLAGVERGAGNELGDGLGVQQRDIGELLYSGGVATLGAKSDEIQANRFAQNSDQQFDEGGRASRLEEGTGAGH